MENAIYPGTFDPITYGHLDVIERAARLFPKVIVAVASNEPKQPLFSLQERIQLAREACRHLPNVEIEGFSCLLIEYVRARGVKVIIRGLRAVSDFEFEFQLALTNQRIDDKVETIFMMPRETFTFLSSRIVKEICRLGGDVSPFVPPNVQKALEQKLAAERMRVKNEPIRFA